MEFNKYFRTCLFALLFAGQRFYSFTSKTSDIQQFRCECYEAVDPFPCCNGHRSWPIFYCSGQTIGSKETCEQLLQHENVASTFFGIDPNSMPEMLSYLCSTVWEWKLGAHFVQNNISELILQDIHLDCASQVEMLFFTNNPIRELTKGTFNGSTFQSIQVLGLMENEIGLIHPETFNQESLSNVMVLGLQRNRIKHIDSKTFSWRSLASLRSIDLSFNLIKTVDYGTFFRHSVHRITNLNLTANEIWSVDKWLYKILIPPSPYDTEFVTVDLTGNPCQSFQVITWLCSFAQFYTYGELYSIKIIMSKAWSGSDLIAVNAEYSENRNLYCRLAAINLYFENKAICDCKILPYLNYIKGLKQKLNLTEPEYQRMKLLPCNSPSSLYSRPLGSIKETDLQCISGGKNCTDQPVCTCVFIPANVTTTINCQNKNITSIPHFEVNTTFVELYFSHNSISEIVLSGKPLEGLLLLDLSFNKIRHLQTDTFSHAKKIQVINLANNALTVLNPETFTNLRRLDKLHITGNPFECHCDGLQTKRTLASLGDIVPDQKQVACASPLKYKGEMILSMSDDAFGCPFINWKMLTAILGCLLVTLTPTSVVAYVSRRYIRFLLFTRFGWRIEKPFLRGDKEFDAFIAYSSLDADWVHENLLAPLENEPLRRICVHTRDFRLGVPIMQNLAYAIESSASAIMVLSENFLRSEWCQHEFRLAHYEALQQKDAKFRVIVVLLEVLPDALLTGELRLYLKTNTYIDSTDPNLIPRIELELPAPTSDQEDEEFVNIAYAPDADDAI